MSTEATQAVRSFFQNPAVANAVVNSVIKKRPVTWGKTSNASYYNIKYAKHIQPFVDKAIASKQDMVFLYSQYPQLSAKTLYLRINQSLLFLVDCLDDDTLKYQQYKNMTECKIEPGIGLRFTYLLMYQNDGMPDPIMVSPQSKSFIWREKIDLFLDDPKSTELFIDKLLLTPDQIDDVRASLILDGIISSVNAHHIKIIKTTV